MIAWLVWLTMARIPLYETAVSLQITDQAHAIAQFSPGAAIHLQPGQTAQLRLDDFPWTEYGAVPATLLTIDNAIQNGTIRVQFQITDNNSLIPLQSGLTGQVEVETNRVSPIALLLNEAGQRLADTATPSNE